MRHATAISTIIAILSFVLEFDVSHAQWHGGGLTWTSEGTRVSFVFHGSFSRSGSGMSGSGPQGQVLIGDVVELGGREPLVFQLGEEEEMMRGEVRGLDVKEDTFQVVWTASKQLNLSGGFTVAAMVRGCCRFAGLMWEGETPFQLAVQLDEETMRTGFSGSIGTVAVWRSFAGSSLRANMRPPKQAPPPVCASPLAMRCLEAGSKSVCLRGGEVPMLGDVDCLPYSHCFPSFCADQPTSVSPPGAFLRFAGTSYAGAEAGATWRMPSNVSCYQAKLDNPTGGCESNRGCCSSSDGTCAACFSLYEDGTIHLLDSLEPGLYSLSLALSLPPLPAPQSCVDSPRLWTSSSGLPCSLLQTRGLCHEVGSEGRSGYQACCECGGGEFVDGHLPSPLVGLDGFYESSGCKLPAEVDKHNTTAVSVGEAFRWNSSISIFPGSMDIIVSFQESSRAVNLSYPPCVNDSLDFDARLEGTLQLGVEGFDMTNGSSMFELRASLRRVSINPRSPRLARALRSLCSCLFPNQSSGFIAPIDQELEIPSTCSPADCSLLSRFGVSRQREIAMMYLGSGGIGQAINVSDAASSSSLSSIFSGLVGSCTREQTMFAPSQRNACGWDGITEAECSSMGCCWDEDSGSCFSRSYRDVSSSISLLRCKNQSFLAPLAANMDSSGPCESWADATVQEMKDLSLARRGEAPGYVRRECGVVPPATTMLEFHVDVLSQEVRNLHKSRAGTSGLLPLNVSFHQGMSGQQSDVFQVTEGFEGWYLIQADSSLQMLSAGGYPGSLESALSNGNSSFIWRHRPTGMEGGGYWQCFQGRISAGCTDFTDIFSYLRMDCSSITRADCISSSLNASLPPDKVPVIQAFPLNSLFEVCCQCGGGMRQDLFTDVTCLPVNVFADPAPTIAISEQVTGQDEPCKSYNLGYPQQTVSQCRLPVLRDPCRPPFDCSSTYVDGGFNYLRRMTQDALLGSIEAVEIISGGFGCAGGGVLRALPVGGFGSGFLATFDVAEPGSSRGTSGTITNVTVLQGGSGFRYPPDLYVAEGGEGCQGYHIRGIISQQKVHKVSSYLGIGLDVEILAFEVGFDTIEIASSLTGSPPSDVEVHQQVSTLGGRVKSRRITWSPPRWFGGSDPFMVCITAHDNSGTRLESGFITRNNKTTTSCIGVWVVKCIYAVRDGEDFDTIASQYDTNWIQIWSLNVEIQSPKSVIPRGYLARIGQLYAVQSGNTIDQLASKFGRSWKELMSLNRDLAESNGSVISTDQFLCLLPRSCDRAVP